MNKLKIITHLIQTTPIAHWNDWIEKADFNANDITELLDHDIFKPLIKHMIENSYNSDYYKKFWQEQLQNFFFTIFDSNTKNHTNKHEDILNLLIEKQNDLPLSVFAVHIKYNLNNSGVYSTFTSIIDSKKYSKINLVNDISSILKQNNSLTWKMVKYLDEQGILNKQIVTKILENLLNKKENIFHNFQDKKEIKFQKLDEIYPNQGFWNNIYYLMRKFNHPIEELVNHYFYHFSLKNEKFFQIFNSQVQIHPTMNKICHHEKDNLNLNKITYLEEFYFVYPDFFSLNKNTIKLPHLNTFLKEMDQTLSLFYNHSYVNYSSLKNTQDRVEFFLTEVIPNQWGNPNLDKKELLKNLLPFYKLVKNNPLERFRKIIVEPTDVSQILENASLKQAIQKDFLFTTTMEEFFEYIGNNKDNDECLQLFLLNLSQPSLSEKKLKIL